ncbi:UNVERIFIED_CONTAM: Laccase-1 [Sesamum angustifolium]|uniref:laccase n=1 Tax=Sesamum angustifolium TaxID=2727405 RepID=A0AAW2RL31_9LAMI
MTAFALPLLSSSSSNTKHFHFNVEWKSVTRLCHRKAVLTVNGEYPGPTIAVHEGDHVRVVVTNRVAANTTIHWHGVRQVRTGWADGPAYITQCPIGAGKTYTYNFSVVNQRGTLWWHAHFSWQRASVYGAFIIYPRTPFPFSAPLQPHIPLIFGEWWNGDVEVVEREMMLHGGGPKTSDAYTINGLPGPLYPCSTKDTFIQTVEPGKTYLLLLINAALNDELFFAVANHSLTVVEIDAAYTKPFTSPAIMIAPGQTTTVLLSADQAPGDDSKSMFVMAARPYLTSVFPFNNSTTVTPIRHTVLGQSQEPCLRRLPLQRAKTIDKRIVTTVSLNLQDCPLNQTCKGYLNKRFYASMNNQSFVHPSTSILESHYRNLSTGFSTDFPENPPYVFNYTGVNPVTENMSAEFGTKMFRVPFCTKLEIVLQDTNFLNPENHPIHVHGHNFFIVGRGLGTLTWKRIQRATIWLIRRRETRWRFRWGDGRRYG